MYWLHALEAGINASLELKLRWSWVKNIECANPPCDGAHAFYKIYNKLQKMHFSMFFSVVV